MCGTAFKNKGVQALLDAVIEFMPSPIEMPPIKGTARATAKPSRARAERRRAVLGAGVQDPQRSVRRQPDVLPRLFRHAELRRHGVRADRRTRRSASGACCRCTPTSAARSRKCAPATSPRPWASRTSSPATRCATSRQVITLEKMDVPGAGHLGGGGAEDQGRPGEDGPGAAAPREGRPVVPRVDRRGVRADHHLRHGRAAPRNHRRPHEARVQGRGQRRQAAGRLSRNHSRQGRERRQVRARSPAAAASTATCGSSSSRNEQGKGYEFVNGIVGGTRAARVHPGRREGHQGSARDRRASPAIPVVDVKVTLFDGSYHDVDSNEMAFKIAGIFGFKDGFRKAKPVHARADHEGRGRDAGGLHGRRHRRPESPPRPDPGMEDTPCRQGRHRRSAAVGDVRLRDHRALDEPGPRDVHDGIREVHGSAAEHRRRRSSRNS